MRISELLLKVAIPLQAPLLVNYQCPGAKFPVKASFGPAEVVFPKLCEAQGDVPRHVGPPDGFDRVDPERLPDLRGWGDFWGSGETLTAEIEAVGFTLIAAGSAVQIEIEKGELGNGYAYIDGVEDELLEWIRRFGKWVQMIVNQPLDLNDPVPGLISDPSLRLFSWAETESERSWLNSRTKVSGIMWEGSGSVVSERKVDVQTLSTLVTLTNDSQCSPPAAVTLLAAARLAVRRRKLRQAIADLGTAMESILTQLLSLPIDHTITLGLLVKTALTDGVQLPSDINDNLVYPRNAAVHRSVEPDRRCVMRAIEIVDGLVNRHHAKFAYRFDLPPAQRPHRQNLVITIPPPQQAST